MQAEVRSNQMQHLLNALVRGLPTACNADISTGLWAAAKIGCVVPLGQLHQILETLQETLPRSRNPRDFSNTLWALGKVGHKLPQAQAQQLLGCFVQLLSKAKVREVADVLWGVASLSLVGRSSSSSGSQGLVTEELITKDQLQQLLEVFVKGLAAARPSDIAAVAWSAATLECEMSKEQLQQLLDGFIQQLSKAGFRDVANMVHGVTWQQQQQQQQQQLEQLDELTGDRQRQQQEQQQKQLQLLVDRLVNSLLTGGSPQDISCALRSLSRAGGAGVPTKQLELLLEAFVKAVSAATARDISEAMAGAATLDFEFSERQLQLMTDAFATGAHQADAKGVRDVLWVCGQYLFAPKALIRVLPKLLEDGPLSGNHSLDWRQLGGIAWACGELGYEDSYRVVRCVLQKAVQLTQQPGAEEGIRADISSYGVHSSKHVLPAKATPPAAAPRVVTADIIVQEGPGGGVEVKFTVQEAAGGGVRRGTTADASVLPEADASVATAMEVDTTTEQAAATPPAAAGEGGGARGGVNSTSGSKVALVAAAEGGGRIGVSSSSNEVQATAITCVCWAAAVLDMQKQYEQVLVLVEAFGKAWGQQQQLNRLTLTQLREVHLWLLDSRLGDMKGLEGSLAGEQLERVNSVSLLANSSSSSNDDDGDTDNQKQQQQQEGVRHGHDQQRREEEQQLQLQKEVLSSLKQLPVDWLDGPAEHEQTADGAFSVSITGKLVSSAKQLAVDPEGPRHYRKPDRGLTGKVVFRHRALAARGYQVVSVPYYEWKAMDDALKRQQYLTELLVHGKSRASGKRPAPAAVEGEVAGSGEVDGERQSRKKRG
jgi:hypothetical protein